MDRYAVAQTEDGWGVLDTQTGVEVAGGMSKLWASDRAFTLNRAAVRTTERDRHQHGDLVIETVRSSDGTLTVRIDPGAEKVRVVSYPQGKGVLGRS